jgi:hypothetical protein
VSPLVFMPGVCRECGCTDERACPGGCSWVEPDLCSACVEAAGDDAGGELLEDLED